MKKSFFLCWTILAVITSQAQIIHVHPDSAYSTIQSGINAASPGDTVLVGDAVYYEQISFMGKKPLMVASYYLMDGDTNHIANTIIDGDSITDSDNGSIVNFKSGEDTTSVLMGFTIRNGNTGTLDFFGIYKVRCGGGIFINQSGAKILHNHITQNHLDDITLPGSPYVVQGAGIFSSWLESEYWIVIQDNEVDFNSCSSKSLQAGSGGVSVGYNAIILNNIVKYNTATGNATASAIAGGLACATDVALNLNVKSVVTGNIISNNKVKSPPTSWANSAGFLAQGYQCTFNGNTVSENYVDCSANGSGVAGARFLYTKPGTSLSGNIFEGDTTLGWGGGLCLDSPDSNADDAIILLENNYFIGNKAMNGGGVFVFNQPVILQNNIFIGNQANQKGGAISAGNQNSELPHLVTIVNTSFANNCAKTYGGAIAANLVDPVIFNSIFWHDTAYFGLGREIYLQDLNDTVEIAYSNIHGAGIQGVHIFGESVIDEDPLFENPSLLIPYHYSPCVDAGTTGYTCLCGQNFQAPEYDILDSLRPTGNGFDMGAYDIEFWGVGVEPKSKSDLMIKVSPNPVSAKTTMTYSLEVPCQVNISIYNVSGQEVANPVNSYLLKGDYKTNINLEAFPAGLYIYRIKAGNKAGSGTLLKE